MTDKEMIQWAGLTYEGDEIPIQLKRLIWAARMQGARTAWRDAYQVAAARVDAYNMASFPGVLDVKNSESASS